MKAVAPALILIIALFVTVSAWQLSGGWADSARISAQQRAADASLQRQIRQEQHEAEMMYQAQIKPYRIATLQNAWAVVGTAAIIGGVVITIFVSGSLGYLAVGLSRAAVTRANVNSTRIYLDPTTRQFPLLPFQTTNNYLFLYNPNNGEIVKLGNLERLPNPQMIAASGAVQYAGVLAEKAASETVSDIRPVMTIPMEVDIDKTQPRHD